MQYYTTISKKTDFNKWTCTSIANSNSKPDEKSFELQQEPELTVVESGKPAFVSLNENVKLNCQVNTPVNCAWKHNGIEAHIKGRYSYRKKRSSTTDCSIILQSVKEIDYNEWTCTDEASADRGPFYEKSFELQQAIPTTQATSTVRFTSIIEEMSTTPATSIDKITKASQEENNDGMLGSKGTALKTQAFVAIFTLIFALMYM